MSLNRQSVGPSRPRISYPIPPDPHSQPNVPVAAADKPALRSRATAYSGPSQLSIKGCGEKRPITEFFSPSSPTSPSSFDSIPPPSKRPRANGRQDARPSRATSAGIVGRDCYNEYKIERLSSPEDTRPPPQPARPRPSPDHNSHHDELPDKHSKARRCAHCLNSGHTLAVCRTVTTEYLKGCPWCNVRSHNLDDCPHRPSMTDSELIELLILNRANTVIIYTSFDWLKLFKRYSDDKRIWARAKGFPHTIGFARQTIANGKYYLSIGTFVYGKHIRADPFTADAKTILKNLERRPHVFVGQTAITLRRKPPAERPASPTRGEAYSAASRTTSNIAATQDSPRRKPQESRKLMVSEGSQTDQQKSAIVVTSAASQTEAAREATTQKELEDRLAHLERHLEQEKRRNQDFSDTLEKERQRHHDELEDGRRTNQALSGTLEKERQRHHDELDSARRRIDGLVDKLLG